MATILVADDNRFTRVTLGRYLTEAGHEVTFAVDGADALEQLEQQEFELMFCDLLMPNCTGFEVLEALQDNSMPVIILSADIQDKSREQCYELGAREFLNKPFTRDVIQAVAARFVAAGA